MSKVQCTFRLPVEVVDLIDEQDGETRTDKLLSLLGFGLDDLSYSVRQTVISSEVEKRLESLESRISELETDRSTIPGSKGKAVNASYEERTKEVTDRCRDAWLKLEPEQRKSITKKDFSELSGVSRGTVTKYWDIFTKEETE